MYRHLINFIILVGVVPSTGSSIYYDEEKTKEPKKTEELAKTDEIPGKLIVQTKWKISKGKFVDMYCFSWNLLFMLVINLSCYIWIVDK